jgi:hypothetical protein
VNVSTDWTIRWAGDSSFGTRNVSLSAPLLPGQSYYGTMTADQRQAVITG